MDIPSTKDRPKRNSFVEGFAASYTRAAGFDPVDSRRRRDSSHVRTKPSTSGKEVDGVIPDRVAGSDFRSFPTIEDDERTQSADETSALLGDTYYIDDKLSTTAQTMFNMVNLLIGIGLLSLPLGFKLAGWIIGSCMLILGAALTGYTAILLTRSLETDRRAYTYSDVAALAYGRVMTSITAIIFMLELTAAGSALFILFGDNMHAVIPEVSSNTFKLLCFLLMLPTTLLPLKILSYTSIIGILSTVALIIVIFIDGVYKPHGPGSLREPLPTSWTPDHWTTLPLALGLFMAPFGGHGVFPQVYVDMQDRRKFARSIWISYGFTVFVSFCVAIMGYCMFGEGIEAEVTVNLLKTKGYPRILNYLAVLMTGITSLTKIPLCTKSISANVDIWFKLKSLGDERAAGWRGFCGSLLVRLVVNAAVFGIALFFPDFDRIMSLLGASFVFLISAILPLVFYIKIMDKSRAHEISRSQRIGLHLLNAVCVAGAIIGTVFALLPRQTAH